MKSFLTHVFIVILLLLVCQGCAVVRSAPVVPPQGVLFSRTRAPLSVDFSETPICEKKGSASTLYVHDILLTGLSFAWDDAGIAKAAANGGLREVEYADYEMLTILGVFGRFTVHAHGR
ncbi:MAG TPA: TRL domain-containing protein [bacterium]|nr:TRL domain-containing protein [bacterium]